MTDKELIQALKDNKKPFGLMSEEMQAKAASIDKTGMFLVYHVTGVWEERTPVLHYRDCTYRLRPDYEEDGEVVKCEVELHNKQLKYGPRDGGWYRLHKVSTDPDFIGFLYEGDSSAYPIARKYRDRDTGFAYDRWKEGREVLTPTHVLFRKETE